jgi:hypothetical protein
MTDNEQVLLESQTARSSQLAQIDDQAEEMLSKAKALHFNVWQGTGIATTEQVAEHGKLGILYAILFQRHFVNATEIFQVHNGSLN